MKVRAHAALSAKGKLEPFEYDPGALGKTEAAALRLQTSWRQPLK